MRKIQVNYSGSYVTSTSNFAFLILLVGVICGIIIAFSAESSADSEAMFLMAVYIIGASSFMFIVLMALSVILKQLLFIRAFNEFNAKGAGFEFEESCLK